MLEAERNRRVGNVSGRAVAVGEPNNREGEFRQSLDDTEKTWAAKELHAIDAFLDAAKVEYPIPLQALRLFLLVAVDEGKGVGTYAEAAGVAQSVASRHLLDMGPRNRYMGPGFGWVAIRPDPRNLRRHQVLLTPEGRALARKVVRILRGH